MNIEFLQDYIVLIVVGICLCIGYILKNVVTTEKVNRFILLVMGLLGIALNVWVNAFTFTPEVLLGGLFSGWASTGLYELFKNLINRKDE